MDAAKIANATLAGEMGVTEQAVGKWLRTGNIARQHLPKLARVLDVDIDWLLTQSGTGPAGRVDQPRYTLDTLATHTGGAAAILEIVDRAHSPDFQPGDLVTVTPITDAPQARYVAIAGRSRAGIRAVLQDADGPVLLNLRTGEATMLHHVRLIGDLTEIRRSLVLGPALS